MTTHNRCQAKNPQTCNYHGNAPDAVIQEALHTGDLDTFENATKQQQEVELAKMMTTLTVPSLTSSTSHPQTKRAASANTSDAMTHREQSPLRLPQGKRSIVETNPNIAAEWHPDNPLDVNLVLASNRQKVRWRCKEGHEWDASTRSRTQRGKETTCVKCAQMSHPSALINHEEYAYLLDEFRGWDYSSFKEAPPSIEYAPKGGRQKAYWACPQDSSHEVYPASLIKRTTKRGKDNKGTGCPTCAGRGKPPLSEMEEHQHLITEFVSWVDENHTRDIREVTQGSNHKAVWQCSENPNHTWETTVHHRFTGSGCAVCAKSGVSKIEQSLRSSLEASGQTLESQHHVRAEGFSRGFKTDILLVDHNIVVEYDGVHWHAEPQIIERDLAKTKALIAAGYKVIRVRDIDKARELPFLSMEDASLAQLSFTRSKDPTQEEVEMLTARILSQVRTWTTK